MKIRGKKYKKKGKEGFSRFRRKRKSIKIYYIGMEVAEYVQWTYYESIWNTIWLESNQDFISLLLFLDITFIQNLEQFLAVLLFFKFSFRYRPFFFISFYIFLFCFVFPLIQIFSFFFFIFVSPIPRRFLKCILSFSKMDRYVWTKTIHQTPKICIYRFRFRPASPPLRVALLLFVECPNVV